VQFPNDAPKQDGKDYLSLIRLITRLIFCWFVKQKELIPADLFDPSRLATLLKNGADLATSNQTIYYKAILQNLFFATLNQEMDKRAFRKRNKHPGGRDPHYGITNLYRYGDYFTDGSAFLDLMRGIPFLNGGLFECLDKVYRADENRPDERIDGFSDHPKNPLRVPDFLFFGEEREVDLSTAYGEARYRRAKVRGLIHTFNRYNFTVTENTPLDQEVALDPELAGKVFENLLAAYNPETATTARKATGSYYTPREIVDYMVDESLIAYLETKLAQAFLPVPQCDPSIPACGSRLWSFSPSEDTEVSITRRNLPHWTKPGAIYWITFRLADALPQDKLRSWKEQRDLWLKHHPKPWSDDDWREYNERFGKRIDEWIDAGMGSRALARPDVRQAVRACLMRFDAERLRIHAAVIMPTHVHALIEPLGEHKLSDLMKGIKGASAREANKLLGVSGQFWLDESFDHIVRSEAQYQHFLRYIADNPVKAHLQPHEYWLYLPQSDTGIPACESSPGDRGIPACESSPGDRGIPACAPATSSQTTDKNVCVTLQQRLRHLLAYNDEPHQFSPEEVDALIVAIDNLKALDPACGSGAFPMGLLHKLVHILSKLDPHNERWKQRQIAKANEIPDATVREKVIEDIEKAFAAGELDYGRKLYLIENCIYGVDIQPIAVQIAKMRFFISLIVDQRIDPSQPNLGIRALPNLETKFVAANTLIGIEKPAQQMLRNPQIDAKEDELRKVRERHFTARTPATKAKYRELDAKLRAEISALLQADGFPRETTEKLARWDPYDQNASADFFDPEWMFGIKDGFDIVIGNPPYIDSESMTRDNPRMRAQIQSSYSMTKGNWDIYIAFYEKGFRLLQKNGVLSFITPDKWISKPFGDQMRMATTDKVVGILKAGRSVFQASNVDAIVTVFMNTPHPAIRIYDYKGTEIQLKRVIPKTILKPPYAYDWLFSEFVDLLMKIEATGRRLSDLGLCENACATSDAYKLKEFIQEGARAMAGKNHLRIINTGTVGKYVPKWGSRDMVYLGSKFTRPVVERTRFLTAFQNSYGKKAVKPKIILKGLNLLDACLDADGTIIPGKTTLIVTCADLVTLKLLLAIINSSLAFFYVKEKYPASSYNQGITFTKEMINDLPVPEIESKDKDSLVALVDKILAAQGGTGIPACASTESQTRMSVSQWEREIDERVYRLYGLTPEEIKIVEESVKR